MQKTILVVAVGVLSGTSQLSSAFDIDAGDVQASIYGYAQLNAVYDINEDIGTSTQAGSFGSLTDGDNDVEGHFDADALQSRLGVSVTHKNGVKAVVEGDFRTSNLRLRHAYGSYNNWIIGKTWSNYNSWTGWTPTLDFDSLAGSPGVQDRTEQVRYTRGAFSVSAEKDYFPNIDNYSSSTKTSVPTFTARYESSISDSVNVVVAGLVRRLSFDDGMTDESALGYGTFAGASVKLGEFSIQGAFNYSDGANAYLYRSGNDFGGIDAYVFNGSLETVTGYGGTLGVSTSIGSGSLNIAYGMATMDLDDYDNDVGVAVGTHETNTNMFINYQWKPMDNVMMGVELARFETDFYGAGSADASRVMYSARYSF
ncbi:DcaP family trimeric outer membrane transporter [Hahella ganghwensis]|uniref:DcaP family trimeric outer membrane transporter n=1 Tax=Hahella ganghwensis TaxID=286420 RepID=UPI0003768789|nr:DcaP family trimeric outer membrane transporter [Hahella ganghwensis]